MDYKYLGMYFEAVLEMYKEGKFNIDSNPEKALVKQLIKKYEEIKKRAE